MSLFKFRDRRGRARALSRGAPLFWTNAFAFASAAGCFEVVALLLRLGTKPDILDTWGHTPLYRLANECGSENSAELVKALVKAGADVNACSVVTRATPLHMAAWQGHIGVAGALLDCGAAMEAMDSKGNTPLQRAIKLPQGSRSCVCCWIEGYPHSETNHVSRNDQPASPIVLKGDSGLVISGQTAFSEPGCLETRIGDLPPLEMNLPRGGSQERIAIKRAVEYTSFLPGHT